MACLVKTALLLVVVLVLAAVPVSPAQLTQTVYTSALGRLWLRNATCGADAWSDAGPLPGDVVDAMTYHVNRLYAVSGGNMFKRSLDNQTWADLGRISVPPELNEYDQFTVYPGNITALSSLFIADEQVLVMAMADHIYAFEAGNWTDIGPYKGINGTIGLVALGYGGLYELLRVTTSSSQLCALAPTDRTLSEPPNYCTSGCPAGMRAATRVVNDIYNENIIVLGNDSVIWKLTASEPSQCAVYGHLCGATSLAASTLFAGWTLVTASNGHLWVRGALGPSSGNDWSDAGTLPGIVDAMTWHVKSLYAVSGGQLFKRLLSSSTWYPLGSISQVGGGSLHVTAMTSHFRNMEQQLVIVAGDRLYARELSRDPFGFLDSSEPVWIDIGAAAPGTNGLVSSSTVVTPGLLPDTLYATTSFNQICQLAGTGWDCYGDSAYGIQGATILNGELIVAASDSFLWKRGSVGVGPNTGNAWTQDGQIYGATALAVFPTGF